MMVLKAFKHNSLFLALDENQEMAKGDGAAKKNKAPRDRRHLWAELAHQGGHHKN